MSPTLRTGAIGASLFLAAACADTTRPVAPDRPDLVRSSGWQEPADPDRARDQRLARRFARAMADPVFRAEVLAGIQGSVHREQRIQVQRFLSQNGQRAFALLARANGESGVDAMADLDAAPAMEAYFPVAAHRATWRGGPDILIATARQDHEIPVAFDSQGRKHLLDPLRPPTTPVLAVQAWEGGDGTEEPAPDHLTFSSTPSGVFLTGTRFFDKFEGWLKGAPEFEIHVLGQKTGTTELVSYQCVGERAGSPYAFNQDNLTWSGSVMLFSQAQLDNFAVAHPGQGLRLLVLEDDDGPCQIKVDKDRVTTLFMAVDGFYASWTSGQQVTISKYEKNFQRARSFYQLISGLASFFATNDEVVGTAIEDPGAAGLILSGSRWIVKGSNNASTGALRIEMQ